MKPIQVTLGFLAASVVVKFTVYTLDYDNVYNIFVSLLFILLSGLFGLYHIRKNAKEQLTFLIELKATMQPAATYILFFSVFLFAYYSFINPTQLEMQHAQNIEQRLDEAKTKNYSDAEIAQLQERLKGAEMIYRPFTWSSITLFVLLFSALFYLMVLVVVFRIPAVQKRFNTSFR